MSETASDVRRDSSASPSGEREAQRADGSSRREVVRPSSDQPTIITGRPPIATPAASDSTYRILEGRIMPGDRLGHFELVEFVGGGGMGRVFRAIDTQLGRTVALKVLAPEQSSDPDALQRFQNEAESSARLDHDNVARVYYRGEDRGLHYIVFEFIEGVNLRALIERKGPLPLAEAVSYTLQVAEALSYADSRAVVHRDIKPSNVLVTPAGRVKLIDLGLARLRHADPAMADLTASGVTLGTFDYISPEQARDPRNADIRSDIYSLGCTFFYMLAGQPPFPEGTVLQKLLQHQGDQPPDIQEFRSDLPEEVSRVMRKMMAKDPRRRYADPNDLVTDLLLLAEEIGLRPVSSTSRIWLSPHEPSVSFLQRHLPWMAPVAALICIVVLLDQYWSRSARRDEQQAPTTTKVAAARLPQKPSLTSAQAPEVAPSVADQSPARKSVSLPTDSPKQNPNSRPLTTAGNAADPSVPTIPQEYPGDVAIPTPNQDRPSEFHPEEDERADTTGLAFSNRRAAQSADGTFRSLDAQHTLIVCEAPQGSEQFLTLAAACAAAGDGDVVELRFNGPREENRPLKLSNLSVTIRAGEGYRPVVVFRPTDTDPVKYPRSMLTLAGGQLTLVDVAMELHIPRGVPADSWSLLETWGGETARLQRCSLTVVNTSNQGMSYHQDVAFLRARSAPDLDVSMGGTAAATPLVTLELTDCVARGEADFLRVEDLQPVHLRWNNGLLLTTERFLVVDGSQAAPKLDEMLRIELQNVTANMRGGLCRLTSAAVSPHQLTVQCVSSDSILRTPPGVPLIVQEGAAEVENFRQRFVWNGNRNFYEDVDVFWTVRNNRDPDAIPNVMDFEDWKTYWGPSREEHPSTEPLYWKYSLHADQPLHAQGPADYTLEDPTFGDASAGAPGCRGDRLPPLPPKTISPPSAWPGAQSRTYDPWRYDNKRMPGAGS